MTGIRNLSTPESRAFWAFVERTAEDVRARETEWQRDARLAREAFARDHTFVECPECDGRGYRSWVNQLGCVTCAGQGGWYEPHDTGRHEDHE